MKVIEIGIVLIIILMIFGVILNSMENATEKIVNVQESNNIEKLLSEVADNLINNPGVPENWNEYDKGTPGLAIINDGGQIVPNSVSYAKLIALGKNYDKMVSEKLFSSKIHTSMELRPHESTISSVKIGDYESDGNIFSVTRMVKCDFYKSYVIKDFQNQKKCNRHHSQNDHSCTNFKVFPGNFKKSDYYLLIDDDETYDLSYIVDTTRVVKGRPWEKTMSDMIYLNDKIDFYDDNSAVAFVHLDKPNPKAVIVSVPKNFDENFLEYDYFRTNDCEFILTAWH